MLSAGFVEGALKAKGWLTGGSVIAVEEMARFESGTEAEIARLSVTYSDGATGARPVTVIAKICSGEAADDGARELRFFRRIAPNLPGGMAPILYAAAGAMEERRIVLILEDLEAAGYAKTSFPVSDADLARTMDYLAALHRTFWGGQWSREIDFGAPMRTVTRASQAWPASAVAQNVRAVEAACARFLTDHELSAEERRLVERMVAVWPSKIAERGDDEANLTLIHGDFHLMGNVFQPRGDGPARVIDWSEIKPGLGPHDVAYALVSAESDDRMTRDSALLRRYFEALGAPGYSWEQCVWDWRFSILTNLLQSVFQDSPRWFRITATSARAVDAERALD